MNTKKKKKKKIHRIKHAIYVSRWVLLAIPGKYLYLFILAHWNSVTGAFLLSQGILGYFIYFVDRYIFTIDKYIERFLKTSEATKKSQKLHRL